MSVDSTMLCNPSMWRTGDSVKNEERQNTGIVQRAKCVRHFIAKLYSSADRQDVVRWNETEQTSAKNTSGERPHHPEAWRLSSGRLCSATASLCTAERSCLEATRSRSFYRSFGVLSLCVLVLVCIGVCRHCRWRACGKTSKCSQKVP